MIASYYSFESTTKISLSVMPGLIGLANDPSDEQFGLLPRFWQQLKGNHIEHLYGLVQGSIERTEVVQPQQQEADYG